MTKIPCILYSFLLGSFLLCLLSTIQKIIAGYPLVLKGYPIPFFYGGFFGAIAGGVFFELQKSKKALHESYKMLAVRHEALTKSEENFRLVADYACDWEYWQEADGTFVYTSPACEFITGYMPEDFSQNSNLLEKIIDPEDLPLWKKHTHAMTSGGEVEPVEFRIRTKTGDTRWIQHFCRDVYNAAGEKCGVRGSNRDITKQKRLQDEVKVLRGFLPICASCKKIRDSKGYWAQIEAYIRDHSEADFSHSICPECAEKLYPEFDLYKKKTNNSDTNS